MVQKYEIVNVKSSSSMKLVDSYIEHFTNIYFPKVTEYAKKKTYGALSILIKHEYCGSVCYLFSKDRSFPKPPKVPRVMTFWL